MDAAGKTFVKRVKASGKKKDEALKIVVPWVKTSSKQPSDVDVASVKQVKWTKKVAPSPMMALATTCISARVSGSKGAIGGTRKAVAPVSKCRVPASHMLAEASSVESHKSSPHDPLP
jgi:hypothetical protein